MNRICLVVGADKKISMEAIIKSKFDMTVEHWTGRGKHLPNRLPKNTELVIIITGFVNHPIMQRTKELAKKQGIKVIYCKRGLAEIAAA